MAESERVADGKDEITDFDVVRLADGQIGQSIGIDLEQRDIGQCIRTDDLGIERFLVEQRNLNLVGVFDNMMIGQDIAILGIDDDTRTSTRHLAGPAARSIGNAEKAAEHLIAVRRLRF